jgi:hypothetical protein
MSGRITDRLKADIAAYNAQPFERSRRTDLHELFLDLVDGLERDEWSRADIIELLDAAVAEDRRQRDC